MKIQIFFFLLVACVHGIYTNPFLNMCEIIENNMCPNSEDTINVYHRSQTDDAIIYIYTVFFCVIVTLFIVLVMFSYENLKLMKKKSLSRRIAHILTDIRVVNSNEM